MSAKFLVVGTVAGGVVLFGWGAVTHTLLPEPFGEFKDEAAVVQAVRSSAAANGMYFARQGVFTSVAFRPDLGDKTKNIGGNLALQLATDTLAALLLCLFVARLRAPSVMRLAGWMTLVGLAVVAMKVLPYWNWYGFSAWFTTYEMLDVVGKFFIGGLLLGALGKKLESAAA